MATRRFTWALMILVVTMTASRAASVKTTNFIVEAARQDDAEEFAQLAEQYRKSKALEWLGKEMPAWRIPCRLRVQVSNAGAGGATTFEFRDSYIYQEMHIEGARERLKNSVLPHEVTHTVFAHHFRQPVPRWADEGGSVYSEDELERTRHDKLCKQILNAGDGIQLKALFRMKEYPRQVMVLYAQGYSVSRYLIEKSDRATFLNFVATGMQKDWDAAARDYYGFRNVDDLEKNWIDHLKRLAAGGAEEATASTTGRRPAPSPAPDGKSIVYDSAPPARPAFDPAPVSRGASPATGGGDRFGGDIGWNRPRLRDEEPRPAPRPLPTATPTNGSRPYSPTTILLPPEPVPGR